MDRQRLGLWGTVIFASLAAIGMAVQVYLIAGVAFGEGDWLDTHKDVGKGVHGLYILTFLSALVAAWPNWRSTLWPFVLAALGSVQAFLAFGGGVDEGGENPAIHAFHGMLAPVVFVIALYVAWQAWLALKATPERPTAAV
jgi:hypothetical protein